MKNNLSRFKEKSKDSHNHSKHSIKSIFSQQSYKEKQHRKSNKSHNHDESDDNLADREDNNIKEVSIKNNSLHL